MKKLQLFGLLLMTILFMASCNNPVGAGEHWNDGVWLLPVFTGIGAIIFLVRGLMAYASGDETIRTGQPTGTRSFGGWNIFGFVFLTIVTIAIIWYQNAEK